jgi:hypothetical protein
LKFPELLKQLLRRNSLLGQKAAQGGLDQGLVGLEQKVVGDRLFNLEVKKFKFGRSRHEEVSDVTREFRRGEEVLVSKQDGNEREDDEDSE